MSYEHYSQTLKTCIERAVAHTGSKQLGLELFSSYFEVYPETQQYFSNTDIASFSPRKFTYISDFFIDTVAHPDFAEEHLAMEVGRHTAYGLKDVEYYYTLIDTFEKVILDNMECPATEEETATWNEVASAMKAHIQYGAKHYL